MSRCEIRKQAQMPAEIERKADVIPIYMRRLSHWESGQGTPTHAAVKNILLCLLLISLVSGHGLVMLRPQHSPILTWTPEQPDWLLHLKSYSVYSVLMCSYSTQFNPSKQHAFEHTL